MQDGLTVALKKRSWRSDLDKRRKLFEQILLRIKFHVPVIRIGIQTIGKLNQCRLCVEWINYDVANDLSIKSALDFAILIHDRADSKEVVLVLSCSRINRLAYRWSLPLLIGARTDWMPSPVLLNETVAVTSNG
jgi:hypothetical protein